MNRKNGTRYTKEFKETTLARMMPPNNESIKSLSDELGISEQSLYKWRQKARAEGKATQHLETGKHPSVGLVKINSSS